LDRPQQILACGPLKWMMQCSQLGHAKDQWRGIIKKLINAVVS